MSSASNAGSRSRSSARASRSARVRRARRAGATAPTWLARMRQPAEWNDPPEATADLRVAVPAEVDHRALRREQVERELQPGRRRARVHDEVAALAAWRASAGRGEADAQRRRHGGPGGVHVDEGHLGTRGSRRAGGRRSSPTIPAPTTATRSPTSGAASHSALTAVSTVPASTARSRRHVVGHDDDRLDGHDVRASGAGTGRRRCGPSRSGGPSSTTPTLR